MTERYLSEKEAFVAGIKRGLAQAEAGKGHSTDEAKTILKKRILADQS